MRYIFQKCLRISMFFFGFCIGIFFSVKYIFKSRGILVINEKFSQHTMKSQHVLFSSDELYDESLSKKLFREVRILCAVVTYPKKHQKKAAHLKKLLTKKCNKVLIMSEREDPVLGTVKLPVGSGRQQLWNKTMRMFEHIHDHHLNDADWFMKIDDDNYQVLENIRYLLYQYRANTSLYIGQRYTLGVKEFGHYEGYMQGGGYILSKKALTKLVVEFTRPGSNCSLLGGFQDQSCEDKYVGACLDKKAIFVNEMDELYQKRFFGYSLIRHLTGTVDSDRYKDYVWYNNTVGMSCCSDTFCSMHYVRPKQMHELEYFIYQVHPFGVDKNSTEKLPKKLSLKEIIAASKIKGWGSLYIDHKPEYNFGSSEYF